MLQMADVLFDNYGMISPNRELAFQNRSPDRNELMSNKMRKRNCHSVKFPNELGFGDSDCC